MKNKGSLSIRWIWVVGAVLAFGPGSLTHAQAPGQEQLDAFRNLSPEQQQTLLQQFGGQRGSVNGTGTSQTDTDRDRQRDFENARRARRVEGDQEPLVPVLKPDDTVLIQVTLPEQRVISTAPAQPVPGQALLPSESASGTTPSPNGAGAGPSRQFLEPIELEAEERHKLGDLVDLVRSRNPYRLDRSAFLNLPGFAPIALGGLTELQATQRLSAEAALLKLDVKLIRLPLAKTGVDGLKPFGYDLFDEAPSTFSPVTDIPVPADYIIGPGDELNVQLFGTQNRSLRLVVGREGTVGFPELGPIRVVGLTFNAAKRTIEERVAQQMIGVRANVSIGELRAIRVFVLGEAKQPGSYAVSGLATMTTALFASGGVRSIGSLRDIQLKRQGQVVRRLDLYDLLIQGDTSDDAKLQAGDAIFIPPVGPTVSVDGEVKRPAIYEIGIGARLRDLLQVAGGLTPDADAGRGSLVRVDDSRGRVVLPVDLRNDEALSQTVRNGDVLRIAKLRPQIDAGVILGGHVYRPGPIAWREGLRLADVIGSVDELKPNADRHYILIRRETPQDRRVQVLSADLTAALAAPDSAANVLLSPRDQLTVFDLMPGRERIIKPLLEDLRQQSGVSTPTEVVRIEGKVKVPGEYPLEQGMRVGDLLRAGGTLDASAYGGAAELARYTVDASGARRTELTTIDLAAVLHGDPAANLPLRPFDYLLVKETPDWGEQSSVTLKGELRFPGTYPIRRGETLRQLIDRAGGLTDLAFVKGGAFTRRELKEREQKQLDQLSDRLQKDIATMSLQAVAANQSAASQALSSGQSILVQLKASKAVGRLVIDVPGLMAGEPGGVKDIQLRDGDELVIPRQRQEVTVIGEVQSATSHFYAGNLKRDDYIEMSGGMTRKADRKQIYVVHADGSVVARKKSLWSRGTELAMQPGDTVVVPLDTERMPRLPFWQSVTQIIYNLAVSVAAVTSF
jgi:protein involved in polysaccharide export with SLBB domain